MRKESQFAGIAEIIIILLFFLSGFSALVYEVVWARLLSLVFGSSFEAVSAVITAFMFGLALGSYLSARLYRRIRKPLQTYAVIEGLIGLSAVALYYIIMGGISTHRSFHHFFGETSNLPDLIIYIVMFFLVAIPTTMMGATYPIMSRFFVREIGKSGRGVGRLYGFNAAGAVLGAFSGGFFLIPIFGMRNTTFIAVLLNVLTLIVVLALLRYSTLKEEVATAGSGAAAVVEEAALPQDRLLMMFLAVFAIAGFTSMVYEVAWTRLLTMVIGNSVYAFSSILSVFLLGTALGSLFISRYVDRIKGLYLAFCLMELGIFFFVLTLLYFADSLPIFFLNLFMKINPSFFNIEMITLIVVMVVVFVPTFFMGALFPIFNRMLILRWKDVGWGVGSSYSANTMGGIFGALIAGFYAIPSFGVQKTILFTAGVNLFIGLAMLMQSPLLKEQSKSFFIIIFGIFFSFYAMWIPRWDNKVMNLGVYMYAEWYKYADEKFHIPFEKFAHEREILFLEESKGATVVVSKTDTLSLQINGKTDAGTTPGDMVTQTMLSALPLTLHQDPKRVAIIGLGSGVTLGMAENFPLEEIDCVEILPAVIKANRFFAEINHNALNDSRLNMIIKDGRHYLTYTEKRYDVIVSEPSNPWIHGMSNLFTTEFFEIASKRLNKGGIMSQWLQTYSLSPDNLKVVINTFRHVFPYTSVWYFGGEDLILIGSKEHLDFGGSRFRSVFNSKSINDDFRRIDFKGPEDLTKGLLLDEKEVVKFTEGAALNTDDFPIIEFDMPKNFYRPTSTVNIDMLKRCC